MVKGFFPVRFVALGISLIVFAPADLAHAQSATNVNGDTPAVVPSIADHDGNRLSDGLERRMTALGPQDRVSVVVTFDDAAEAATAQPALGTIEVHRHFRTIPGFAGTMTAGQARSLAARAGVARIEEDVFASGQMDVARAAFGVDRAQAPAAFGGLGLSGAGVTVCVVDTGILASHEQFSEGGFSKVREFVDLVNGRPAPYDDNGHGTLIAGIIAGDGTGSSLAGGFRGVAPAADLYVAKVLDATNVGPVSTIIAGIEWCASQPTVDIINLSLTTFESSDGKDALSLAANAAVEAGKVVLTAAGNFGAAPETIGAPGAALFAITVGAAAEPTADHAKPWHSAGVYLAPFSSRGPTADGRVKPDIAAPGVTIAAAGTGGPQGIPDCTNCYEFASGTSMATAFASGVAALMVQAGNGALAPQDVAQILFGTAQPRGLAPGKNNEWGFGLLDAFAAASQAKGIAAGDYAATVFPDYARGLASVARRGVTEIPIEVVDPLQPLAITITSDGRLMRRGWKPNLDARLLDETFVPVDDPDALGTCPNDIDSVCGAVGRQETIHLAPPLAPRYVLEVWPDAGAPTRNAGGDFTFEFSNARSEFDAPLAVATLVADAGADQRVRDADKDGVEFIVLDGSASGPAGTIASWEWSWNDASGPQTATGISPVVALTPGEYAVTLTVIDVTGLSASDTTMVTVRGRGATKKNGGAGGAAISEYNDSEYETDDHDDRRSIAFRRTAISPDSSDDGRPGDSDYGRTDDGHHKAHMSGQAVFVTSVAPIPPEPPRSHRAWNGPAGKPANIQSEPSSVAESANWSPGDMHQLVEDTEPSDGAGETVVANAGADRRVIDANGDGTEWIALDGSDSGPADTVASWTWSWVDGSTGVTFAVSGAAPSIRLPVGEHVVTLDVTDIHGQAARDTVTVVVDSGK